MDKPISKGDLVMVLKPSFCCGSEDSISHIFTVAYVVMGAQGECRFCGHRSFTDTAATGGTTSIGPEGCDIRRLKRIDPGILSEDVPTDEKVSA